ncbi:hypothetical protein DNTS_033266, partial [Danionella cerebrum]
MAINTDAPRAADAALHSSEFGDTQKLLDTSDKQLKRELSLAESETHLASYHEPQPGENTVVTESTMPRSESRVSFSRVSSPAPGGREPRSFMWMAVISCFCPAVPINIFALYFAHM